MYGKTLTSMKADCGLTPFTCGEAIVKCVRWVLDEEREKLRENDRDGVCATVRRLGRRRKMSRISGHAMGEIKETRCGSEGKRRGQEKKRREEPRKTGETQNRNKECAKEWVQGITRQGGDSIKGDYQRVACLADMRLSEKGADR